MKSRMKNKFLAMIVTFVAIFGLVPLTTNGAETTNQAPTLIFGQEGGEVVKQSNDFKTTDNPNGYGTVKITAKDPDGDGIGYILYNWDYDIEEKVPQKFTYHEMIASRTENIEVPQTIGLHILRICAIDQEGNKSDWIKMPYYIVNSKSAKADTTPPLLDQNNKKELPGSNATISVDHEFTLRVSDQESGIYYIAYAWTKTSAGSPALSEYTIKTQPVNGVVTFKIPENKRETGKWTLRVFAANSTYTGTKFMTSNIIRFNYNVADLTAPSIKLNGEQVITVPENGTYVDEGATIKDNYDPEKTVYADQTGLQVVGENTYHFATRGVYTLTYKSQDNAGNETEAINRTIKVVGEKEIVQLRTPDKTNYNYGEELDLTGAYIKVTSTLGEEREVAITEDMFTNFNTNRLGSYVAEFTAEGKTLSYPYTVRDYIKEVELVAPTKTSYDYKEELDLTKGTVKQVMASGANRIAAPITTDMLDQDYVFDSDVLGEKTINVNYSGKTVSFKVTVEDKSAPVITLTNGTETEEGINRVEIPVDTTDLNLNDYTVTDNYDDDKNIPVEVIITSNNVNTAKAGEYTVVYEAADSNGNTTSKTRKVVVTIDKSAVDTLKDQIKDLVGSDYTDESWKNLEDATKLPDDTTKDLQDKVDAIKDAINNLVKKDLDTTEFDKVREEIKELITHKEDYTAESWKNLEDKFADSQKAKETGLQSKLDDAVEVLKQAIKDLVANPVNQDAISEIEKILEDPNTEINYTQESIQKLQDAINDAKAIEDLQSKFDKAVEDIQKALEDGTMLEAKTLDTSVTDAIKTELAKLDENAYTEKSWKEINDAIAVAEAKTLQTEYNEAAKDISLDSLVLIPVISDVQIATTDNKSYIKPEDTITITFKSNTELDLEETKVTVNSTDMTLSKVEGEENKYQATYTMNENCKEGNIRYGILAVETREYAETELKDKTGIIFDKTAPVVDFANDSEGNKIGDKTLEVKTEGYTVSKADITISDNYTEAKDLKVEITELEADAFNKLGEYTIEYKVTDLAGNPATIITRKITVVDTTAPVITLNGDEVVILEVGDTYTEAGATVTDNYDTEIQSKLVIGGSLVDTSEAGTYLVTYNVTDGSGVPATEVTRTVRVLNKTALKEVLEQEKKLEPTDYTEGSLAKLEEAKNLPETTQEEVDAKTAAIKDVIDNQLVAKELDKTELNKVIAEIKKLVKDDYTAESWKKLANKVKEAREATLQSVLNAKVEAAKQAIKDLVANPVDQSAITKYEDILNNENTAINYTEESIQKLQEAVNNAKAITDLQSKFANAIAEIETALENGILEAKPLDTSVTDAIKAELAKLDENAYTEKSWKEINDAIAAAEAKTLQTEYNEVAKDISLDSLVLIPVISEAQITTSNENKGFANVNDTITITFKSNTELKLEKTNPEDADEAITIIKLNNTVGSVSKVEGKDNEYEATFKMNNKYLEKELRFAITAVETKEGATAEYTNSKAGIIFDMTAPTINFAEGIEENTEIEVKDEYTTSASDVVVSDNYTDAKDIKVEVTTDLDVNTVKDSYTVTYTVTDAAGNEATKTRTIKVVDTTAPEITLIGDEVVILEVGDAYVEAGATVTDNYDTNIQDKLSITGEVNIYVAGTYTVTYTVTDNNNNTKTETRTVRVLYKGALKEAIAKTEGLVEGDYKAEAWKDLDDAKKLPETTQTEVDVKTKAIEDAVANLEANKNALKTEAFEQLKAEIEKLKGHKDDYTAETWDNVTAKLEAANTAEGAGLQSKLDKAVADLQEAVDGLVAKDFTDHKEQVIKELEDMIKENYVEDDYTEESWKELQDAINNAKEINDLQSRFDNAIKDIKDNIDDTLQVEKLNTTALDAIIAQVKELNKDNYTENSWKKLGSAIANAKAQTLQSKLDAAVNAIDLKVLVLKPAIVGDVNVTTTNSNEGFATVDNDVTVTFTSNTVLDKAETKVTLNNVELPVEQTEVENQYKATFKMDNTYTEGELSYTIKLVEDIEKAEKTENGKTGIIFDMTGATIDFAEGIEENTEIEVKDEYTAKASDVVVSDNYTDAKDIKVEVTTDLDVNTVKDSYTVTYTVTDAAGNVATKTRTIKVVDTTEPEITLKGDNPVIIEVGDAYVEAGATVTDNYDTDIQDKLSITGEVNIYVAGTYTVTYTVTDNNNNTATETRTVRVLYKGALKEAIAKTEGLVEDDYTAEAWKALQDALKKAENLKTQTDVDQATKAIEDAVANLEANKKPLNTEAFDQLKSDIEKLKGHKDDYTAETWDNVTAKLEAANTAEGTGLQSKLDKAVADLQEAVDGLAAEDFTDHKQQEVERLENKISEEYNENDYTEESWKELQDAINNAKEETLKSEFDKAIADIEKALEDGTVPVAKELNTAALDAIIAQVEKLNKDDYTENSWKAVGKLISTAKAQTVQSKLDEAVSLIDLKALVLKPVITKVEFNTDNDKTFVRVGNVITVLVQSNVELDLTKTVLKLNETVVGLTKVVDNYQGTFAMPAEEFAEGEINYSITAVETREGASVEKSATTGITFDKTAPTITLANGVEENATVKFGDGYTPSKEDVDVTELNLETVNIVTGGYDNKALGTYTVTYQAVDKAGNISGDIITRNITVEDYEKGIQVKDLPTKIVYGQEDTTLEVAGGTIEIVMASGNASLIPIPMTDSMIKTVLDSTKAGKQTITVKYHGFTTTFNITILDTTAPNVILEPDTDEITIEVGGTYTELGVKEVLDNEDENLVAEIIGTVDTTKVGDYTIIYKAVDSNNNVGTAKRTIHVVDTTKPVVTIEEPVVTIEAGQQYDLYTGVKANDNYDGEISVEQVKIVKKDMDAFKADVPGTYKLRYFVTDSSKNTSEYATRMITVQDTTSPVITLKGEEEVTVQVGGTYTDEGVTVTDNSDKDVQSKLVVNNPVDTSVVADYTITYNVIDANGNVADQVTRTVHVVDTTKPVITLTFAEELTVKVGGTYNDFGATASDNYDGDITSKIVVNNPVDTTKVGEYTITYDVTDNNGNAADQVTRKVNVIDDIAPDVILLGEPQVTIIAGEGYNDPKVSVTDNYYTAEQCEIIVEGDLDTNKEGEYTLTYYAKDGSGNISNKVTRKIKVQAVPPVISFVVEGQEKPVELTEGKVFKKDTEITFDKGTAKLVNKTTGEKIENFKGGELSDGEYTITATDNSGSQTTINFTIDSTAPVVNLRSGFYEGSVTIEFEDPDDVHSAILVSSDGANEIKSQYNNGITITKKGAYSLFAFDANGNYTRVDFEVK